MKKIIRLIIAGVVFIVAAVYGLSPLDFMPDPIFFDDLAVVIASGLAIHKLLFSKKKKDAKKIEPSQ